MKEGKKIVVTPAPGVTELIIKEGTYVEPKHPLSIEISGVLDTPNRFLASKKDQFNPANSYLVVNRNALSVTFHGDERNPHTKTVISGSLKPSKILAQFEIGGGKLSSPMEMVKLLRRTPFLFPNKDAHADLVRKFLNFQGKITTIIENNNDNKGNVKRLLETQVEKELPDNIVFKAPIFEGEEALTFKVEICCEATTSGVAFYFESPELIELEEAEKDRLLGIQAKAFEEWGCAVVRI